VILVAGQANLEQLADKPANVQECELSSGGKIPGYPGRVNDGDAEAVDAKSLEVG
jgi:hypothetical protein